MAARGTCLLDRPEETIEDPVAVKLLRARARRIHLGVFVLSVIGTGVAWLIA